MLFVNEKNIYWQRKERRAKKKSKLKSTKNEIAKEK